MKKYYWISDDKDYECIITISEAKHRFGTEGILQYIAIHEKNHNLPGSWEELYETNFGYEHALQYVKDLTIEQWTNSNENLEDFKKWAIEIITPLYIKRLKKINKIKIKMICQF